MKLKLDYQAGGWFINGCRASKSMALIDGVWYLFDGIEQSDEGEIIVQLLDRDGAELTAPMGTIEDIQEI